MNFMLKTLTISISLAVLSPTLTLVSAHDGHTHGAGVEWTDMSGMPVARSDLSATVVTVGGYDKIYLFGGCSADQVKAPWDDTMYYCPTITSRCDVFDISSQEWGADDDCTDAPRVRYRHAAVAVDNKIFLVGGVDGNDDEVQHIDVYDPSDDSWEVFGVWEGATSDLAAFVIEKEIFLVGGYVTSNYEAQSAVWKFDTTSDALNLVQVDSMKHPRGDIFAAVSEDYVYVTGGFSHVNGFSSPLETVERLNLDTSTHSQDGSQWERVANMTHARGDKALMHMNGKIYAIGGEKTGSTAIKDVEVFDELTGEWTVETEIDDETFRFVAVAHEASESIYIFGGQNYYNATCDCYKISNDVLRFVDEDWAIDTIDGSASGTFLTFSVALCFAAVVGMLASMA